MGKPKFCICENKDADQLRGNREAHQRLCFRYIDSTIPLLPNQKFQASSHLLWLYSPVCVGPGRNQNVGFLMTWLIFSLEGLISLNPLIFRLIVCHLSCI